MPDRSRKRPSDVNAYAPYIVRDSTGEDKPVDSGTDDCKDPAAVALGRKGGLVGGKARAEKMTADERSAVARKAANARWAHAD